MKIAILGYGSVGKTLATLFSGAGYDVAIGLRNPQVEGATHPVLGFKEAIEGADLVTLALPYTVCTEILSEFAGSLAGKTVIDATNPLKDDWSPLLLGQENSAGEEIARLLPDSKVVKAFNTIFADVMDKPIRDGQQITAFIAGDDDEAKRDVKMLAAKISYAPLDVGPLKAARYLENMAHLNIQIAVGQSGGTDAAFIYSH